MLETLGREVVLENIFKALNCDRNYKTKSVSLDQFPLN